MSDNIMAARIMAVKNKAEFLKNRNIYIANQLKYWRLKILQILLKMRHVLAAICLPPKLYISCSCFRGAGV